MPSLSGAIANLKLIGSGGSPLHRFRVVVELANLKQIIRPFMPPRPTEAPPEPDYSKPGVLEEFARQAGLTPKVAFDVNWAFE
jgi:hypothetical protein